MTEQQPTQAAILIPARESSESRLEERVDRLEEVVNRLQSSSGGMPSIEEQLSERVLAIIKEKAAAQRLLPMQAPVPLLPAAPPPGAMDLPSEVSVWTWLNTSILGELRLIVRMYFDPRYRLSRLTQFGVPIIVTLVVLNYLFFTFSCLLPTVTMLPQILERIIIVVLAFGMMKILSREAARYRSVLEYLSRYGYS
jgi:hypothetical protein